MSAEASGAAGSAPPRLALYETAFCPFCIRVRQALERLESEGARLEVERRDLMAEPEYARELIEARGRRTVPVLRIEEPTADGPGPVRWLPESMDIIAYLEELAGQRS